MKILWVFSIALLSIFSIRFFLSNGWNAAKQFEEWAFVRIGAPLLFFVLQTFQFFSFSDSAAEKWDQKSDTDRFPKELFLEGEPLCAVRKSSGVETATAWLWCRICNNYRRVDPQGRCVQCGTPF